MRGMNVRHRNLLFSSIYLIKTKMLQLEIYPAFYLPNKYRSNNHSVQYLKIKIRTVLCAASQYQQTDKFDSDHNYTKRYFNT
jgi:hypothetical protein